MISVTDPQGEVLWQAHPRPKQVVEPQVAATATDILQDAVSYGTGRSAIIGRPQLGKTGTAETHTNAWFVGAIPQLTAAVWVGFHEGSIPMEPPRTRITVFGGTWPAQIWRLFMLRAAAGLPQRDFPTPEVGYVSVSVDVTQSPSCLPNAYTLPQHIDTLQFIQGTEPSKICTTPTRVQSVPVPSVIGLDRGDRDARARGGRVLRGGATRGVDPAAGHGDLPGPRGRHPSDPDGRRDDHGVDRRRGAAGPDAPG